MRICREDNLLKLIFPNRRRVTGLKRSSRSERQHVAPSVSWGLSVFVNELAYASGRFCRYGLSPAYAGFASCGGYPQLTLGARCCRSLRELSSIGLAVLVTLISVHAAPAQTRPADLVIINANIHTIVTRDSKAEALAVSGNRIAAVGSDADVRKLIGRATRVIDARGRLLIPGFNDAHVHFTGIGNTFSSVDLRYSTRRAEAIAAIEHCARFMPGGRWILGSGWRTTNQDAPTRKELDIAAPENPMLIYHADAGLAFANEFALKAAGLKNDSTGIDRGEDGMPTGVVRGEALRRISRSVPTNHTQNWSQIAETATNYAASLGVTSVQDMHSDDLRAVYRELERTGKLKTRVYDCLKIGDRQKLADSRMARNGGDMVTDGCVKTFSDGNGEDELALRRDILAADKLGLQVMVHAIGKSANDIVLRVFESLKQTNGSRDRRLRVEHAHDPRVEDLPRFAKTEAVASMQPYLFEDSEREFYARLLGQATPVAFGSDAAMVDLNPLLGIHAAVNTPFQPVSVYEAVKAYTLGSAFAQFQEREKGTIEVGKLADFVILSDDIFTIDRSMIRDTRVQLTFVDGREVYRIEGK